MRPTGWGRMLLFCFSSIICLVSKLVSKIQKCRFPQNGIVELRITLLRVPHHDNEK
jgi:hypothetical protein